MRVVGFVKPQKKCINSKINNQKRKDKKSVRK